MLFWGKSSTSVSGGADATDACIFFGGGREQRSESPNHENKREKENVVMSSTAIIICLIGIALAIVLNYKFGVNMGVTGLAVAWIAGCIVMGLKVKDVVALWPNSVVFQLMSITRTPMAISLRTRGT